MVTTALGERAGEEFAQRRWREAANLARQAVALDHGDTYAWDVIGSSQFIEDKPDEALDAWNEIGKPRVDLVRIKGLGRTRYQTVSSLLGLRPGALLTADGLRLAERRAEELPDRTASSVTYRPAADGFAQVDVAIVEHRPRPRGAFEWAASGARSAIDREVRLDVPGFSGQGELWSASWRWWSGRPRVALGFATPNFGKLPGIWRVDGSWESQAYALDNPLTASLMETRLRGSLSVSNWLTSRVRYALSGGFDSWNGARRTASIGASLEYRWLGDRLATAAEGTSWLPVDASQGFQKIGLRVALRSTRVTDGWTYRADAGVDRVSDTAPLALWPGSGEGQAREPLLRAHPLLDGGAIDLNDSRGTAFGRTLAHGTVETARWFASTSPLRIALAGFADTARASRSATGHQVFQVDIGAGVRVKVPGAAGILRVDAAHGLRDGADGVSIGWQF